MRSGRFGAYMRKLVFGGALVLLVTSIVFSLIGVLAVWNPLELFQ